MAQNTDATTDDATDDRTDTRLAALEQAFGRKHDDNSVRTLEDDYHGDADYQLRLRMMDDDYLTTLGMLGFDIETIHTHAMNDIPEGEHVDRLDIETRLHVQVRDTLEGDS